MENWFTFPLADKIADNIILKPDLQRAETHATYLSSKATGQSRSRIDAKAPEIRVDIREFDRLARASSPKVAIYAGGTPRLAQVKLYIFSDRSAVMLRRAAGKASPWRLCPQPLILAWEALGLSLDLIHDTAQEMLVHFGGVEIFNRPTEDSTLSDQQRQVIEAFFDEVDTISMAMADLPCIEFSRPAPLRKFHLPPPWATMWSPTNGSEAASKARGIIQDITLVIHHLLLEAGYGNRHPYIGLLGATIGPDGKLSPPEFVYGAEDRDILNIVLPVCQAVLPALQAPEIDPIFLIAQYSAAGNPAKTDRAQRRRTLASYQINAEEPPSAHEIIEATSRIDDLLREIADSSLFDLKERQTSL